jgi:DNA-binding transcriptional LysR family regulator
MDKIRALRYFLKVAETSSFTMAAKALSVPASSVSRRIRDLEAELKIDLFHRSTRVVKLSALGQIYYEQVKDIVAALDNADDFVSQRSEVPSGVLRITAMPGYGTLVLQPVLEKLRKFYPEIILDVELTDQVSDISKNEVDIAIRASSVLPVRAVARKLSDNRFVLMASPEYLETNGVPMKTEDLVNHQTLLYRGPNGILHWQAKTDDTWRELSTKPVYISNDGSALIQAVLAGQGIALLPKWAVVNELEKGALRELGMEEERVSVTRALDSGIYLLYLKPRYRILKIKAAVDFLVAELSQNS